MQGNANATFPIKSYQLPYKWIDISAESLGIRNFLSSFSVHFSFSDSGQPASESLSNSDSINENKCI